MMADHKTPDAVAFDTTSDWYDNVWV